MPDFLHVCYLLPPVERYSPQTGGAIATLAMQQGRRLQKRGYRISVAAPHEKETAYEIGEFHPLRGVTRTSLTPVQRAISTKIRRRLQGFDWLYFEHYRAAAMNVLKKIQPDVVICFNDWQTPLFVRQVLPDSRIFLRLSNECRTKLPSVQPTLDAVERIFAVSSYIRDWTQEHFDIAPQKFVVLPNGADLDSFFPAPEVMERVEDSSHPVRALFLSRINPDKGPDIAADAVKMAQEAGANVQLTMAGGRWFYGNEDELSDPFVQKVKAKADAVKAIYLGHVGRDRVPELFREHDILLFPIRWQDPMPQVVFEAMASGCAVLSSPLGGVPEACGEAALWAQGGDTAAFATHLHHLDRNRQILIETKHKSLQRAREMTWDRNAAAVAAILEKEDIH